MEVHGFCDPKFDAVREAMVQNFEQHGDVGASVALTLEGEFVCDLWAGVTSEGGTDPWKKTRWSTFGPPPRQWRHSAHWSSAIEDYSIFKHRLPSIGRIRSKWKRAGVSQSLPGAQRRALGTGRHYLERTLYDWDAMCRLLAEQAPWWPPGSASGYHAITQGI